MYSIFVVAFFILSANCQSLVEQEFTESIRRCRQDDAEALNVCILKEIRKIQPQLANGLPELGVPQLEPLLLGDVAFRQSEPPVTIESVYKNVMISGISNFDLKYLDIEYGATPKVAIGMVLPILTLRGQYTIGGNIFLLPIEGDGNFVSVLDGVIAEGTGELVSSNGILEVRNVNIGFKIRSMKSKLDNLFQGNQLLSDTLHHFLNENGQLVLDEVRHGITDQLNSFVGKLVNGMFKIIPRDILEDIPTVDPAIEITESPAPPTRQSFNGPLVQARPSAGGPRRP